MIFGSKRFAALAYSFFASRDCAFFIISTGAIEGFISLKILILHQVLHLTLIILFDPKTYPHFPRLRFLPKALRYMPYQVDRSLWILYTHRDFLPARKGHLKVPQARSFLL